MASKILFLCFTCALIGDIHSSAIPMWEFLKQEEKMSFLYSIFASQIEEFCGRPTIKIDNCNLELLKHGLKKLKAMTNEELDMVDPYQRNANILLWDTLMEGHQYQQTTPLTKTTETAKQEQKTTTTPQPNSIYDQNFGDFNSDASARIDNYYVIVPPPPTPFMKKQTNEQYLLSSSIPQYYLNRNSFTNNDKRTNNDIYTKFQLSHEDVATTSKPEEFILTGPMVFRVYPDGRPVNDNRQLPEDDDLRYFRLTKMKIPTF